MEADKMNWQRMRFKGHKVWQAIDKAGSPILKNGKVLIKYQLDQDYEYWVHEEGVKSLAEDQSVSGSDSKNELRSEFPENQTFTETVSIYTDGASSGNPGPSGIGIYMRYGDHEKEISKYIGHATNNIAELEAIRTALAELKRADLAVRIYTDSNYAFGVLSLGWKASKNLALVKSIKKAMMKFRDLRIIKIKGHSGLEENERADFLATSAIKKGGK
ncbi:ribonuclease HI [Thermodesulfobacteriota bacterium]